MTAITDGYIGIGYKQADMFRKDSDLYIQCLVKFGSQRSVMITVYQSLVMSKRIKPIERLPISEQWQWRRQAEEDAAGTLEPDKVKILGKCLYCLSYLLQN